MSSYAPVQIPTQCLACSGIMDPKSVSCPHCGVPQVVSRAQGESDKRRLKVLILCLLFGVFGVHRFYVGKTASGIFQLITIGGAGIWMLVDLVIIAFGDFTDGGGNKITIWA